MVDFSIVIAVYNGAKTLPNTLNCLRAQTYKNFEIVLVNDESQDYSEEVIKAFIREHSDIRIQYVQQKNKGLGGARNRGMHESAGRFIALLDQDDIWYPQKLEKVRSVFENRSDVSFVTHRLQRCFNGKMSEVVYSDSVEKNLFRKLLFDTNFLCGCAMSFCKDVLGKIGYFSEDRARYHLSEDYDYWLRASAAGLKFHQIEEVLGGYVVHAGNFSRNRSMMYRNEWNVVKAHYQKRPFRKWWDPLLLGKRKGKILARQTLTFLGVQ